MSETSNVNSGSNAKDERGGFDFGPVIYGYSRAQFIQDGGLIVASDAIACRYFKCPVGITRSIWEACINERGIAQQTESENTRLRAVLEAAVYAARRVPNGERRTAFFMECIPTEAHGTTPVRHHLLIDIGGGDEGEMVITIMRPSEA